MVSKSMSDDQYLIIQPPSGITVEICRSFSFKLNVGNYESRDFFCSEKASCPSDQAEAGSRMLYEFCKSEVMHAVRQYAAERARIMSDKTEAKHPVAAANAREFENRRLTRAGAEAGGQ